ncbi:MAG: Ribulose-phosphate 3-epimerase [Planctomycetota bacterium]|jgi:ribulose-phosphate 3-epimerase
MNKTKALLAPSILAADFKTLADQIQQVEKAGANRIHIDAMDGQFVPNLSFGIPVIQSIRSATRLPFESHLMINNADNLLDAFIKAGSDSIIVHQENNHHLQRLIQRIRDAGKKAGVAINPATPVSTLENILPELDVVLIMTVNPGFGGQKFLPQTLSKISTVAAMIKNMHLQTEIEVDGGIDAQSAPLVVNAGANVLVAGSAIFGDKDGILGGVKKIQTSLAN